MKVILVGASGRIGRAINDAISGSHEVVKVGHTSGDVVCDYTNADSVRSMYDRIGAFDALVCVAGGDSQFKQFDALTDEDFAFGFERKFPGLQRNRTYGSHLPGASFLPDRRDNVDMNKR